MVRTFLLFLLISLPLKASVVGVTSHPLSNEARVLSGELQGYFNERHEMGAGLRYTQSLFEDSYLDLGVSGGQYSRALTIRGGVDIGLLPEEEYQPRISVKPFGIQQRFEKQNSTVLGVAPTFRKSFSINEFEFHPFVGLPNGIRINGDNDELDYYSALSLGANMPFPFAQNERVLLTLEGNKNLGQAYDFVQATVSLMWK